ASIGNIFFNHRLFLIYGESKYYDVLERILYNAMLSGVSLSGDHFFYPNVLESDGKHARSEWFGCACCPSNIARFIPSVPGYIYATDEKSIFVNLYMSNDAVIPFGDDTVFISQYTGYPWDGRVNITINPIEEREFTLKLRIPGWAGNKAVDGDLYSFIPDDPLLIMNLEVNGRKIELEHNYSIQNGYASIKRRWQAGDEVTLDLPMSVKTLKADERVESDRGLRAYQRGPIVFAAEWADNDEGRALNLIADPASEIYTGYNPEIMEGSQMIWMKGVAERSYSEEGFIQQIPVVIKMIPYHLWNNRGPGEMRVWLPQMER
ncbi:MAG TPA: beta-L-arabinofuranosidase domain-containing protein, partial [Bacteroidales bacterium]|nr:beta-L-arabinofuranosidase domain-containing protein [Bacteroidales bacterium]